MKSTRVALGSLLVTAAAVAASSGGGCSATSSPNDFTGAGAASTSSGGPTGGAGTGASTSSGISLTTSSGGISTGTISTGTGTTCSGLACQIHGCSGGGSTEITGTIYDPAGKTPLYGVVAYVPNGTPAPILSGTACTSCDTLYTGDPIAAAVSDVNGKFTIKNAPDGANIPLVIQIGKWRRQFTIPNVAKCGSTPANQMLSLPSKSSEGDLPNIAISTGGADSLECLLVRVGVDEAEYVSGNSAGGHVHIFQGNNGPTTMPAAPVSSQALWDQDSDMMPYDIVLLSCEGSETTNMNQQVLLDYTNQCGRVFASHFHYAWFDSGPFSQYNLASWSPGSNQVGNSLNATVVTSFPMGMIFDQWLTAVGALTNGELTIDAPRHNADLSAANPLSQGWLLADQSSQAPGAAQDFSFDTPLAATDAGAKQGRVVFSDMHVGAVPQGVSQDYGGMQGGHHGGGGNDITPSGCVMRDLTAQEQALEFILFNLSSCVTPNGGVQMAPPTPPPPTQ